MRPKILYSKFKSNAHQRVVDWPIRGFKQTDRTQRQINSGLSEAVSRYRRVDEWAKNFSGSALGVAGGESRYACDVKLTEKDDDGQEMVHTPEIDGQLSRIEPN